MVDSDNLPPIRLISSWSDHQYDLDEMWDYLGLEYVDTGVGTVPRAEAWFNNIGAPYTYGRGKFARTYQSRMMPEFIEHQLNLLNDLILWQGWMWPDNNPGIHPPDMNCCFVNGYKDHRDHLGWHADDSPEMNDDAFIAICSFGAEREIWFKRKNADKSVEPFSVTMTDRSVLFMYPGMQKEWLHRIPKASRECGPRISLTFRGLDVDILPEFGDPTI